MTTRTLTAETLTAQHGTPERIADAFIDAVYYGEIDALADTLLSGDYTAADLANELEPLDAYAVGEPLDGAVSLALEMFDYAIDKLTNDPLAQLRAAREWLEDTADLDHPGDYRAYRVLIDLLDRADVEAVA